MILVLCSTVPLCEELLVLHDEIRGAEQEVMPVVAWFLDWVKRSDCLQFLLVRMSFNWRPY